MIIFTDENGNLTGYQLVPSTTNATHVISDIPVPIAKKIVGRANVSDLSDIDSLLKKIEAEDIALEVEDRRVNAKKQRDISLGNMTHDFGDGRVMQVRPSDEANIIRAIEIISSEGLESVDWVMADNTKHAVTADELREALRSGRLQGLAIWNEYNP